MFNLLGSIKYTLLNMPVLYKCAPLNPLIVYFLTSSGVSDRPREGEGRVDTRAEGECGHSRSPRVFYYILDFIKT